MYMYMLTIYVKQSEATNCKTGLAAFTVFPREKPVSRLIFDQCFSLCITIRIWIYM